MTKKPEILSPAGNFEKLRAALAYGADAVYLAGVDFGMRATDNFTDEELDAGIRLAHSLGKRVYVTVNILPHDDEYPALEAYLRLLAELKPDALIVADLGVMSLCREIAPQLPLHVSTQASAVSARVCREYRRLGAERVILARELTLADIAAIRRAVGEELELECFVHGAMCVSYSGMCLLSENLTGRDANHGRCTQPCRWHWRDLGRDRIALGGDGVDAVTIAEEQRPDEPFTLMEDKRFGSMVLSSRDLCMIEHLDDLLEAGVSSFKIEGRMKSAYYTAAVTNAYRMALDDALAGRPFDVRLLDEVESVSHRAYGTGHFYGGCGAADAAVRAAKGVRPTPGLCMTDGYIREKAYLATVTGYSEETKTAWLVQHNKLKVGDACEALGPGHVGVPFSVLSMTSPDGMPLECAPHPGMAFSMPMPSHTRPGDIVRAARV